MFTVAFIIVLVSIQVSTILFCPTYQKGKFLTMPLRRRWPNFFNPMWCRLKQLLIILLVEFAIPSTSHWVGYGVGLVMASLYIDDWFGDDEKWKKRFLALRNKFKWKMEIPKLPSFQPQGV